MTSGGSQVNASTPWGQASPYLTDIMAQAQKLYGQQTPNYANPAGNFGYGQATGAVGDIIGGATPFGGMASSLAPNTTAAIQKQLSGTPDYTAVKSALDAANQQTWDSFNNQELPQLNQRASFLGNPSGAIKDLNWATANIGRNMDLNAQQQYLGEYDQAQQRQAAAAGLGANIAQGAAGQQLQGANLYQSLAQMPNQSLADYANAVSSTGGRFGTNTETEKAGAGQTAANIIGGLTAGAGLLNTLTGTSASAGVPGAASKIGSWLGGSAGPTMGGIAGMTAGTAADIGAGTSAAMAGTASDVAASNAAWLAAQPAAAGTGLGAGAAGAGEAAAGAGASGAAGAAGAGEAAAGSGGGSAAGAGLGAIAGPAAAALLFAAPIIAGMSTPAVRTDAQYNANLMKGLNSPPGSSAYIGATQEIISQIAQGQVNGWGVELPQEIQDKARQLGLFDSAWALQKAAQAQSTNPYQSGHGQTYHVSQNKY